MLTKNPAFRGALLSALLLVWDMFYPNKPSTLPNLLRGSVLESLNPPLSKLRFLSLVRLAHARFLQLSRML